MKTHKQPGKVKSALLNWLGVPIELTTGTFWQEWMGRSSSGKVVSAEKAIHLSAVWACVRLLSESISTLPSAMAVEESAAKIFENGLQSSGFLSAETPLNDEQRERLRGYMQAFTGSRNARKIMVLEGGLKYQNVTMNPEAAQMLESRSFSIEEICRWFRVPPFMVGHADKQSSWASSVEGMNLQFLTNTLRPMLVNIEQEISRCLLDSDDDLFAEFSVEGLLRADSAGRSAYYTTALQNGWMSRNDVRRLENLPPIEGGDIYTVQLNLTPLEDLKQNSQAAQAKQIKLLHSYLFPDIPFEQSPLTKAA